jgi:hypothetical protein
MASPRADGVIAPGAPAPSGAALARVTGFSTLTCRKALNKLIREGTLAPGPSPNARPRVPAAAEHDSCGTASALLAGRTLSTALGGSLASLVIGAESDRTNPDQYGDQGADDPQT